MMMIIIIIFIMEPRVFQWIPMQKQWQRKMIEYYCLAEWIDFVWIVPMVVMNHNDHLKHYNHRSQN